MIDLHCHMLPGVDDGAPDLATALDMARIAVNDGTDVVALTPHFLPGVHDNEAHDIDRRIAHFNEALKMAKIPLAAVAGADAHVRPDFVEHLLDGRILTLNRSRYVLVEPPHQVKPPRLDLLFLGILESGHVPILTHPERLVWMERHYSLICRLVEAGMWIQITAGSLAGRFGAQAEGWARRMLRDGIVHLIASDAHNLTSRPPGLSAARAIAAAELGALEARHLVFTRAFHVLRNDPPEKVPAIPRHRRMGSGSLWGQIRESIRA